MNACGINSIQYTIQRISSKDIFYGNIHASKNAKETICGEKINNKWYILTNDGSGKITCESCIKLKKGIYEVKRNDKTTRKT